MRYFRNDLDLISTLPLSRDVLLPIVILTHVVRIHGSLVRISVLLRGFE